MKRFLIYASTGFLVGMLLVLLLPAIFNITDDGTARLFGSWLIARVGSARGALAFSLLVFGIYGAFCIGGMLLYEIDHWPLALATAVHYLGIALGYVLAALLLGWELTGKMLLLIEGGMAIGFVLIWLIMYLCYKTKVQEINELMKKRNKAKIIIQEGENKMNLKTLIPIISMVSVLVMFVWSYLAKSWEHSWLAVFAGGIAIAAISLILHNKEKDDKDKDQ